MSENKAIDKANLELALSENNKKILEYTDTADTELRQNLNVMSQYQKYLNTELDSCYCGIKTPYTPVAGQYIPFIKTSGTFEVNNGRITIKPGQRVQINVTISYHNTANKIPANISYDIKDYTNNIVIGGIHPVDIGDDSYEYPCAGFYQYTNETKLNCEIGVYVNTIWSSDIIDINYTFLTVQEINRQITIDPIEHVNTEYGLEDTPVGHIISHMGTKAPKHYLICDGSEYNILDYPELANHILDNFGSYNYFGGDGITTFAVPDLRGEFLRGSGTAARDTGSGGEVGEHQDGTQHINFRLGKSTGHPVVSPNSALNITNQDKNIGQTSGESHDSNGNSSSNVVNNYYTSRPTNTSVLYCIKYEPTYYTSVQNTNYLSPSLYSEEEKIIGCWIDGKPLYEKTIANAIPSFSTSFGTFAIIENLDALIQYHGFYINNNDKVSIPYINLYNDKQYYIALFQRDNMIKVSQAENWTAIVGKTAIITLQYTKTTDEENSFTLDMLSSISTLNTIASDEEVNEVIGGI